MKLYKLLILLGVVSVVLSKRPPWYKPCWIYMCGIDPTEPVCAWDPHHGARIFRNDCERARHNFCYNRNYAVVDNENTVDEDIQLCTKLKTIVQNADDEASVVQDGNVRVHFLEDPNFKTKLSDMRHRRRQSGQPSRWTTLTDRERFTSESDSSD